MNGIYFRIFKTFIVLIILITSFFTLYPDNVFIDTSEADSHWTQTTEQDFLNGTLSNVEITSNGEIKLLTEEKFIYDDFINESMIDYKENILVENNNGFVTINKLFKTFGISKYDYGISGQQTSDGGF